MLRLVATAVFLFSFGANAAPQLAIDATDDGRLLADLSLAELLDQAEVEVFDAEWVPEAARPRFTLFFDRVGEQMHVRLVDDRHAITKARFALPAPVGALDTRAQARLVANKVTAVFTEAESLAWR